MHTECLVRGLTVHKGERAVDCCVVAYFRSCCYDYCFWKEVATLKANAESSKAERASMHTLALV